MRIPIRIRRFIPASEALAEEMMECFRNWGYKSSMYYAGKHSAGVDAHCVTVSKLYSEDAPPLIDSIDISPDGVEVVVRGGVIAEISPDDIEGMTPEMLCNRVLEIAGVSHEVDPRLYNDPPSVLTVSKFSNMSELLQLILQWLKEKFADAYELDVLDPKGKAVGATIVVSVYGDEDDGEELSAIGDVSITSDGITVSSALKEGEHHDLLLLASSARDMPVRRICEKIEEALRKVIARSNELAGDDELSWGYDDDEHNPDLEGDE